MKTDTIQTRNRITTCLMALLTFCLVLTGVFFIAPLEAEAAEGDTFVVDNIEYTVLTEEEGNYTVEVSGNTLTSKTAVVIPSTVTNGTHTYKVTAIASASSNTDSAFGRSTYLTSVSIPDGVTSIGKYAFSMCSSLTSVSIPASVTSIGVSAFSDCTALENVEIPKGVTSIGNYAFNNCTSLQSIEVAAENTEYASMDGVLYNKAKTTLIAMPAGKSVTSYTVPASVTAIGNYAFYGCTTLESIVIPNGVESIGIFAFSGCTALDGLTIPDSVTSLGNSIFSGCTALKSVVISDSVPSIGSSSFSGCTSLKSVVIPKSVTSIDRYAFHNCTSLDTITILSNNATFGENVIPASATTTVYGYENSTAQAYCSTNDITFVAVEISEIHIPDALLTQSYLMGDAFVPFDIDVVWNSGATTTARVTADMLEGFSTESEVAGATATVAYEGETATFTYTVTDGYAYRVEHYQENLNDDGYTLVSADTENLTGVGMTNAVAKTYTGFTAQSFEQKTIAEDGSTVVEIYYTRNSYTIILHPENGSEDIVINYVYGEVTYESFNTLLTENEPTRAGFYFIRWALSKPNYTLGGQPPEASSPMPQLPIPISGNYEQWAYYGMNDVEITEQPQGITVIYDGESHTLSVDVSQDGNSDFAVVYQWQLSTDGTTWNDIVGATGSSISVQSVSDSGKYRVNVTVYEGEVADNRRSVSATSNEVTVTISKADQTITLSEDEFTYSEGLTIDFADYVSGTGDGTLSFEVSNQNGVTFDFANGVVSNLSAAGGTFTLTVTKAATDNYNSATQTFTVRLNKGTQNLSVSQAPSAPTWKESLELSVSGNVGALSYAIVSGNATINESGVITAEGAGDVRYSVTAAETNLYEAVTVESSVTFEKAEGNLAPDYALPTGFTLCVGKTTDYITLPDGWRFRYTSIFNTAGVYRQPVIFTPDDTVNYNEYIGASVLITVNEHDEGTEASCTSDQTCTVCGDVLVEKLGHSFTEEIEDEAHLKANTSCVSGMAYWYDCARCDAISDTLFFTKGEANEHSFGSDGACETCGAYETDYEIASGRVFIRLSPGHRLSVYRDGFTVDTVTELGIIFGELEEIDYANTVYTVSGSTEQTVTFYAATYAQVNGDETFTLLSTSYTAVFHQLEIVKNESGCAIGISRNVQLTASVYGITRIASFTPENNSSMTYPIEMISVANVTYNNETHRVLLRLYEKSALVLKAQNKTTTVYPKYSWTYVYRQSSSAVPSTNSSKQAAEGDTCLYYEYPVGESVVHDTLSDATCTKGISCAVCGVELDPSVDPDNHIFSAPCDTTCNEGCGYTRPAGDHTYTDCCDMICDFEDCGNERELTPHVHIGSSVLTNGQHLDEEGNVSATKPTGGYAHLAVSSEGTLTLTLHDFTYEGNAYYSNVEDFYAVIYSALDLTVKVEGENLLFVNEFEGESYLISIVVNGNLTVKGDGKATSSLEIGASAELIYCFEALSAYYDLTIENVSVKAIDAEYGISGESILITNSKLYLATLQDCISTYRGDIKISNSVLELYSTYSWGIYIGSAEALLIEGSEVYIHANGIYAPEELSSCTVTNSDLTVYCYDNAILCGALEATDSNISITGMASVYNGENDTMISASVVVLEDCTLYIDTNNYCGLKADVASFVSCDIFVYGSYGGLYAGELTLEGCTLVSEGENYGALGADALRIVGGSLTSDFVLADAYESFTVEGEAQLNGIVYTYDSDTQTTSVTVYGEACVGKNQWLNLDYEGMDWREIAGLRVDGWLYLPEGVTGQQIAELGLTGDGVIRCGYDDQTAFYDTSGNALPAHYEYEGNLDFSNMGDGEGQTPTVGNGYSFDADTLTLTLTNLTIRGDLYLPHGDVTVVLNEYVSVYGSIYLAEGEGNASISLEGDGGLWVDEGVEIMHESVLTSEMALSLEIGEKVLMAVDNHVMATSLSVYGRLETQYVYIYAMQGGGLRIGEGGVVIATDELTIVLFIDEEPNAVDVDPWDYVVIDGGHLSGGIIPVYGDLDGAYGIFFVPEGLETNYYWNGQRAFLQSLSIESHEYDNACDTTCNVCGAERTVTHDFTGEWEKDASGHWHVCETEGCTVTDTKAGHTSSGSATEDTPETCTVCGYIITPATGHINHTSSGEYGYDANGHWFKCVGCESEKLSPAGHNFDNACDVDCICGYQRTIEHDYTELKFNDTHHWYECSVCGAEQSGSRAAHNGGDATCVAKAICSCGQSYGGYGSHRFGQWQEELPATCVATGTKAHKTCSTCEKHFAEDGVTEINDLTIAIDANNHDIATEWTGVENGHYHKCKRTGCEYHTALEDHQPDRSEATEDEPIKCSVCEYIITPATGHTTHTSSGIYRYDANGHWFKCVGCETEKVSPAGHGFDNDCDTDCACGYVRTITHNFTGEWQKDENGHWHVCATNGCTATDAVIGHTSSGEATEQTAETCTVCGFVITPATGHTTHTPEAEWQKNETHHWHECTGCDGQELDKAAHNDGNNDGSCDACGYAMGTTPPPHTHSHGSTWVTDANEHWNECECGDKANKAAHFDDNGDNKCDTCDCTMPAHDPDTPPVDNPPTDDNDGLGTGAIIGIVVASVAVVGGGGFAIFWFVIRKKRR